jgi:RND superfamily putative drug exporter
VALGLQRSGRIVTSAALLIAVVFACFMVGGNAVIGQIGLGLTLAVLLDATVVRMLLVPATMALLGHAAWWPSGTANRRPDSSEPPIPEEATRRSESGRAKL